MPENFGAPQYDQRVMVVDDEFHVCNTIAALLEKRGYRVESFENAVDALMAFQERGYDLVLSDVKMLGMDGIELLGRIHALDLDVPVILMTGFADLSMVVNAVKMGVYDFIIKPFDPDVLMAAVDKGLKYRYLCRLEKEYKRELEDAVAKKSKELQELHGQIILNDKMASIGLLSAGIAHEINNPVAFIASNLGNMSKYIDRLNAFIAWQADMIKSCCGQDLLEKHEEYKRANKTDHIAKDIFAMNEESLEGIERIKKIVTSLKSFSRKDENVLELADLNDLVESTLTIVWNEIKYVANLNKELGDIPSIRCYPSQLNQVIMNLLVNAAHAIEKGPGTISVKTWADDAAVFLEISDTGCGISPENLSKIFTPFFTTKEAGKGTGLGLSICYEIVSRHNGVFSVKSDVGKGSAFTVSLPVLTG